MLHRLAVAMKHVFPEVPANSGVLEPVDFIIDENSILSVKAPKPVGGYTETILRIIDLVFQALALASPELTNGCAYGTINALSLAGYKKDGSRWVMFSFFGGPRFPKHVEIIEQKNHIFLFNLF